MKKIEVNNLTFSYGQRFILNKVSFGLEEKSITAVLGCNNSGKTTLVNQLKKRFDDKLKITTIFYKRNFKNTNNTVKKEILSRASIGRLNNKNKTRFNDICSRLDLTKSLNKKIKKIGNFDKVRLLLAASLINDLDVIVMDDIFDLLSYDEYVSIANGLNYFKKEYDVLFVYTTCKLDLCSKSDYVLFLNNKKIELSGTYIEMLGHDSLLYRSGIIISTMLDLSLKLNFYNLLDSVIIDPYEMVNCLWK